MRILPDVTVVVVLVVIEINCDDQNCGYQQKIRDIEKCICESHRDEQKQDELRAVNCIKNNANYFFRYAKRY